MYVYYLVALIFIIITLISVKFNIRHLASNYHFIFILFLLLISFIQKDDDFTFIYALLIGSILFRNYFVEHGRLTKYVKWTITIVFLIALIELILGEEYHQYLDTFSYYLNSRGRYSPISVEIFTQVGAYRGAENYFLSFINYRVSSIFLEPLSMAYFSVICFAYLRCLSVYESFKNEIKKNIFSYLMIITLIIVSDTRSSFVIILFLSIVPKFVMTNIKLYLISIPTILVIIVLTYLGSDYGSEFYRRTYPTISAFINLGSLFNFSRYQGIGILDSGYGVLMSNLGIFGFIYVFKIILYLSENIKRSNQSIYFFNFFVIYNFYFAIFGGAFLSIKTWVLLFIMFNTVLFYKEKNE